MVSESVHIKERKGRIRGEEGSYHTYIHPFPDHALTLIMLVLMETTRNERRKAAQRKGQTKFTSSAFCLELASSMVTAELSTPSNKIWFMYEILHHAKFPHSSAEVEGRLWFTDSPVQPQLSSWWIIKQQGRSGVLLHMLLIQTYLFCQGQEPWTMKAEVAGGAEARDYSTWRPGCTLIQCPPSLN